jgi:acyl-CoA thioester hydrolase
MPPGRTARPTASSPAASLQPNPDDESARVPFTFSCPVRWGDMDAFGHVNNVTFFVYMQEARTAMLFSAEAAKQMPELIAGVVVARHEIDYRRPLEWRPEPIEIDTWTSDIRQSSFTVRYRIRDQLAGLVLADAMTVLVPFDLKAGRPRRLAPNEREFLKGYLEP